MLSSLSQQDAVLHLHLNNILGRKKNKKNKLIVIYSSPPGHLLSSIHVKVHGLIYIPVIYPINNRVLSLCLLAFY